MLYLILSFSVLAMCNEVFGMQSTTRTAATPEELYEALSNADGGDTIILSGSEYGEIEFNKKSGIGLNFDSEVRIVSEFPENPASFGSIKLDGAQNITFEGIMFNYTFSEGDAHYSRYFEINNSENIKIVDSVFDGDRAISDNLAANGFGEAIALSVRGSDGVTVTGTEFYEFHRGVVFQESTHIVATDNEVHTMSSDGFNFVEVQGVLVEGNHFHDFAKPEASFAHQDFLQFWTKGTDAPSANIVIRGNTFDIGDGQSTQSIFMRNEAVDVQGAGPEMFYQNVLIEDNYIYNGHLHGITVGEASNLTIRNNTLVSVDAGDENYFGAPLISVKPDSVNITIADNITKGVQGFDEQESWTLENNVLAQQTNDLADGHYGDIFLKSSGSGDNISFMLRPGDDLDGAGASVNQYDPTPVTVTPLFDISSTGAGGALVFDASYTAGPEGALKEADAVFVWTFGDGTTATGRVVEHAFDNPGRFDVLLNVTVDGQTYSADANVGVAGENLLSFDATSGTVLAQRYGTVDELSDIDQSAVIADGAGFVIDLGQSGTALEIPREELGAFSGAEGYTLSFSLRADGDDNNAGEILRLHTGFVVSMDDNGDLFVDVFTGAGTRIRLSTGDQALDDGAQHDIDLQFDSLKGTLTLWVDGVVAAETDAVGGAAPDVSAYGLTFGNPWGKDNFDGVITAFNLDVTSRKYPSYDGGATPVKPGEHNLTPEGGDLSRDDLDIPADPEQIGSEPEDESRVDPKHDYERVFAMDEDEVISTGGSDAPHTVSRTELASFFGASAYTLSFNVEASDPGESYGEVLRLHHSFTVSITEDGDVRATFFNEAGEQTAIQSEGLALNDGDTHELELVFDSVNGHVQAVVDGVVAADSDGVEGAAPDVGYWDLSFGNPWSKQTFDGAVSGLSLDAIPEEGDSLAEPKPVILDSDPLKALEAGDHIFTFDTENGFFYDHDGAGPIAAQVASEAVVELQDDSHAINLGEEGAQLTISRDVLSEFFGAEAFELSVRLQATAGEDSSGEIARVHQAFILGMDSGGDLNFVFYTDAGESVTLETKGMNLNDGAVHDIDIRFEAKVDTLQLLVSGEVVAEHTDVDGAVADMSYWDLNLGNPWGKDNFDGELTTFDLIVDANGPNRGKQIGLEALLEVPPMEDLIA